MDTSTSRTSVLRRTLLSCLAISASLMLPASVSADDNPVPNIAYLLSGTWNGSGHQQGTQSDWSIRLNVIVDNDTAQFKISYPSLKCGGTWTLQREFSRSASFIEHITFGTDKCVDGGTVTVALGATGTTMAYQWIGGGDSATGSLTRQ
jgi:hypothetical protein